MFTINHVGFIQVLNLKKVFDQFSVRSSGRIVLCNIPTIYRILNIHATLGSVGRIQLFRLNGIRHKNKLDQIVEFSTNDLPIIDNAMSRLGLTSTTITTRQN